LLSPSAACVWGEKSKGHACKKGEGRRLLGAAFVARKKKGRTKNRKGGRANLPDELEKRKEEHWRFERREERGGGKIRLLYFHAWQGET